MQRTALTGTFSIFFHIFPSQFLLVADYAFQDALELFKEVDFDGSGWTSNAFDCLTQAFICKAGGTEDHTIIYNCLIVGRGGSDWFVFIAVRPITL